MSRHIPFILKEAVAPKKANTKLTKTTMNNKVQNKLRSRNLVRLFTEIIGI